MSKQNHHGKTPEQRLNKIVSDGMCIGCGLCESIAGKNKIKLEISSDGLLVPKAVSKLDHSLVDLIYEVCPGTKVEGLANELLNEASQVDPVWGPYQKMQLAWASDETTRFQGATGGVLTGLANYLISHNKVDYILHAKASKKHPNFGQAHLSTNLADVKLGTGSRYGATAALIDVNELLKKGKPFAYIGLPCDISALRNYAKIDERVDRLIKYWLTPVCGGFMPTKSMIDFLNSIDIDYKRVRHVRYRGYGCPGPTRIELDDGTVIEKSYTDFWGEDESSWSLPHRCKMCPDGIGESADIAASDTWPGGSPDPLNEEQDPGTNAVIVRTEKGLNLLNEAVSSGFISLGEEIGPRYMDRVQPHQVKKKRNVFVRFKGQHDAGGVVPKTSRLRLKSLSLSNDKANNESQYSGAYKRYMRLKNYENR